MLSEDVEMVGEVLKRSPDYATINCCWSRIKTALAGLGTTPNKPSMPVCPSCKSVNVVISEYLCLTCDHLFIKEEAGKPAHVG